MHLLQVLQPPKVVFIKLGKICNSFLWDKSVEVKSIHWTAWEKLCYPLEEGGLGLRSFEDMSLAFACKLWWRLRKKESIWTEFMHDEYIRRSHPSVQVKRPPLSGK